jgi:hypothetical protein
MIEQSKPTSHKSDIDPDAYVKAARLLRSDRSPNCQNICSGITVVSGFIDNAQKSC